MVTIATKINKNKKKSKYKLFTHDHFPQQKYSLQLRKRKETYSLVISKIVLRLGFLYLLRSKEEQTTLTEESAMHAPAAHGGSCTRKSGKNTPAAIGMDTTL